MAAIAGSAVVSVGATRAAGRKERQSEVGSRELAEILLDAASTVRSQIGTDDHPDVTVGIEEAANGEYVITVNQFLLPSSVQASGVDRERLGAAETPSVVPDDIPGEVRGRAGTDLPEHHRSETDDEHDAEVPIGVQLRNRTLNPEVLAGRSPDVALRSNGKEIVPASDGGVSVFEHNPPSDPTYDYQYDPLAAGAAIGISGGMCSLGLHAEGDIHYMTTAGHCMDGNDNADVTQPHDSNNDIGRVEDYYISSLNPSTFDGGIMSHFWGSPDHHNELAAAGGVNYNQVTDIKSMLDIVNDYANDEIYAKRGAMTGYTSGEIGAIYSTSEGTFWVDANAYHGDSGAPSYDYVSYDSCIAAGSVNGPRAATFNNPPSDPSHEAWHQTVFTAYVAFENEFDVTIQAD